MISDASYRQLVEGIVDVAIFMLDVDGNIRSWNLGAQRLKGYAAHEIVGKHFSTLYVAGDCAAGIPQRALSVARSTGKFEGEGWRMHKNGSRFWASVVIDALRDEAGDFIGFAKVTRDTTERSVAEEQRRLMVDASPNGMLIIDTGGTVTQANAQADRIFGYRSGGIIGLSAEQLIVGSAFGEAAGGNATFDSPTGLSRFVAQTESIGRRCNGTTFPLEAAFNVTPTMRGAVVVASVVDITDRRAHEAQRERAESALLAANRLMTMAEELARYGHWRVDLRTQTVLWSEEVYRIYGLPASVAPTLAAMLDPFDRETDVRAIFATATIDGEPFNLESRLARADGRWCDVRAKGRGERDASGTLTAIVGVLQDITERKDAQRERDRLVERMTLATQAGKIGIWEWDFATDELEWDARMFALYGLDPQSAVPSFALWEQIVNADDLARTKVAVNDAVAGRRSLETEFRITLPDGKERFIRALGTVVRANDGTPTRMIGLNWDITEVRTLAQQLQAEKDRQATYERERLYEHERKWSTTFQRAVLPLSLPAVAGCTFDAVYEPGLGDAQVGGDWYDAVRLIDGRVLVSIGDVSGGGLEAAVVVGVVRQIMRGISQLHANPRLILDAADRALCLEYPGVYVSAWVGVIDLVTRTITYASAGHPPPLAVTANGGLRELGDDTTLLIGLREGHRGQASTATIAPGDTFVLYTDGVTEAAHDVLAGTRALGEAAARLAPSGERHPAERIKQRVIPHGSLDDVAILVVRTDCAQAEAFIERWQYDVRDRDAANATRAAFVDALAARGASAGERADAELILGELTGNVVRHAKHCGNVEVALDCGGQYGVLHVLDRGPGFHHISRLPPDPYAENGRGLFLIAALAIDFTVSERPDGGSHARVVLTSVVRRREATAPREQIATGA